ncbi:MAG: M23 family metallopeptidase [Micromonosporaceae bacterium]
MTAIITLGRRISRAYQRRTHRARHHKSTTSARAILIGMLTAVTFGFSVLAVAAELSDSSTPDPASEATTAAAAQRLEERGDDRGSRQSERSQPAEKSAPESDPESAPESDPKTKSTTKPEKERNPQAADRSQRAWGVAPIEDYTVTSGFGPRWGVPHMGVDLAAGTGTPIHAVKGGTVVLSGWHGGYGKAVVIKHGSSVQTLYGHTSKLLVQEGQQVKTGQPIAEVGSTGDSTGPHLHLEVHEHHDAVNPVPWLRDHGLRL